MQPAAARSVSGESGGSVVSSDEVEDVATQLDHLATWIRRVSPRSEFNVLALSALNTVDRHGPQRLTDLARQEQVSQAGMSGLVDRLVAAGFAQRLGDAADRRVSLVAATAAGTDYLRRRRANRAQALAGYVARLPADQLSVLGAAADALGALAAMPTAEVPPPS